MLQDYFLFAFNILCSLKTQSKILLLENCKTLLSSQYNGRGGSLNTCAPAFPVHSLWLTTAGPVVRVQGIVSWAATDKASHGDSQAQVGAVPVAGGTLVPACLPGGVEHQDVHHVIQVALDDGSVLPAGLVGPLDAAAAPVCPVNVILVLGQPKGVGQIISYDLTVQACVQKEGTEKWSYMGTSSALLNMCPAQKGYHTII